MYLKQQITQDSWCFTVCKPHNELVFNLFTLNWVDRCGRLNSHLFIQGDIAFRVHLVLRVASTGSFAGTKLDINIHLKEEIKFFFKNVKPKSKKKL